MSMLLSFCSLELFCAVLFSLIWDFVPNENIHCGINHDYYGGSPGTFSKTSNIFPFEGKFVSRNNLNFYDSLWINVSLCVLCRSSWRKAAEYQYCLAMAMVGVSNQRTSRMRYQDRRDQVLQMSLLLRIMRYKVS